MPTVLERYRTPVQLSKPGPAVHASGVAARLPDGAFDEKGRVKGNDCLSRQIYLAKAHSPLTHRLAATVDSALVQEVSGVLQEIGKLTYGITGRRIASGNVMKYQSGERSGLVAR